MRHKKTYYFNADIILIVLSWPYVSAAHLKKEVRLVTVCIV